jgi:hypothetical protein
MVIIPAGLKRWALASTVNRIRKAVLVFRAPFKKLMVLHV